MAVSESDIKFRPSVNNPTDNVSTAGGDMDTGAEITNAAPGEWSTRLEAKATGTVDASGDIAREFNVAYISNEHATDSLELCGYYCDNGIADYVTAGVCKLTSTSASDGSSRLARVWGVVSGAIASEDIVLNGTTQVSGLLSFTRIERIEIRSTSAGNAPTAAVGRIDIEVASGQFPGHVPAGFTAASREFEFAAATVIGDRPTWANRVTDPGGLTWSRAYTAAGRVYVRNDSGNSTLDAGEYQAIYTRVTIQPGMGPFVLQRAGKIYGSAV